MNSKKNYVDKQCKQYHFFNQYCSKNKKIIKHLNYMTYKLYRYELINI